MPEFAPKVLEALRQPLESGTAVIARANHHVAYPARFQLVAAMNPCQCGRAGEPGYACPRGGQCAERYQARLSGPLIDRIDMMIEVPAVGAHDLMAPATGEPSAAVAARVAAARDRQAGRYAALGLEEIGSNAEAPAAVIERCAEPDPAGRTLLGEAAERLAITARGYYRVLRIARTLADLDGAGGVGRPHIAEALAYRGTHALRKAA